MQTDPNRCQNSFNKSERTDSVKTTHGIVPASSALWVLTALSSACDFRRWLFFSVFAPCSLRGKCASQSDEALLVALLQSA
eukprot:3590709-Amphidinium_carterae.1